MFPFIRHIDISTMFHELFCPQSLSGTGRICDTFLHQNTKKCSHTVLNKKLKKLNGKNPLHGITQNNTYTSFIFLSAGSNTA